MKTKHRVGFEEKLAIITVERNNEPLKASYAL